MPFPRVSTPSHAGSWESPSQGEPDTRSASFTFDDSTRAEAIADRQERAAILPPLTQNNALYPLHGKIFCKIGISGGCERCRQELAELLEQRARPFVYAEEESDPPSVVTVGDMTT